jgi:hypothetical protein
LKTILSFITLTVFVTLFSGCNKASTHKVKVKYVNITGSTLNGLRIGRKWIGKLENSQETKYLLYKDYNFDSGLPDERISGKINGDKINDMSETYWCGTQKYTVEEGTFEIEIHKQSSDSKTWLMLAKR